MSGSMEELYGPVIHAYTRAQALEDGTLRDVTKEATQEMSPAFRCPVAVTRAVWESIRNIPESLQGIADERGRLHDVLWMALVAAQGNQGGSRASFQVILPRRGTRERKLGLLVDIGPGDEGEAVVTIGYPEDF